MKRALTLILSLAFAAILPHVASAKGWDAISKDKTIRFATEGTFPPFNEFKSNKLGGFEVEVADAVAKALGLKSEWKTFPFDSLLIGLNQDRYDLVAASHGITPERATAVEFTDPHYCTGGVLFSREGGPLKEADLKGKVVAVQVGTTYLTHLKKIPGVKEVKTYPTDRDSLQNLIAGRADAWITDKFVGMEGAKANPKAGIRMGDMLFQEKVAMAVAKGNTSLRDNINRGLAIILKNGEYAVISKKIFGQDIRCK